MHERGASSGVVIAVTAVILLLAIGGYELTHLRNTAAKSTADTITAATGEQTTVRTGAHSELIFGSAMPQPPDFSSVVRVDNRVSKDNSGIYVDRGANASPRYVAFAVADPASLKKLTPVPPRNAVGTPVASGGGAVVYDYYRDSQNVYALPEGSADGSTTGTATDTTLALAILAGADPATFEVLANNYAKDATHVYILQSTCDAQGTCTETLSIVPGADPATFNAFAPSVYTSSDGSGTVTIDGADDQNAYYLGVIVDISPLRSGATLLGVPDQNGLILLAP